MNLAVLCEFGSLNGGEHSLLALLPLLRRRGITIRPIAPPRGPLAEALHALDLEPVPFETETDRSLPSRRARLETVLKNLSPDLLHANSVSMSRLAGPVAQSLRLPSLGHLRDIIRLSKAMIGDIDRHDRILAVSDATRQFHVAQGLDPGRVHVLYNGVDPIRFAPGEPTGYLHRQEKIPPGTPLLATIGQIGLRKGQNRLLDALEPVFRRHEDVHLLLVGRRWSEKEESVLFEKTLQDRAARAPFRGRVRFLGRREDVDRLLVELTALVHPARQEPLGRVLLEAASCGVPVIATEVGGTREIFPVSYSVRSSRPDAPGPAQAILVHPDCPDMLTEAVEAILADADLRNRLGHAARRRALAAFSSERAAAELYDHYVETVR